MTRCWPPFVTGTSAPAAPAVLRTRADLARLLSGLDVVDPGVVSCPRRRPDIAGCGESEVPHFCAVARKPAR